MQFQREQYPRYTSPDSISAYRAASGYLSPPYSGSRRLTSENAYMPPMTGLGIRQPHTFQMQQEQQEFYQARAGHARFSPDAQRHFSSPETVLSPPQTTPLPTYTQSNDDLSYYMTPGHEHLPHQYSPSKLVRLVHQNHWQPPNYDEHTISPSIDGDSGPSHFTYRPDSTQDRKWTVGSHEEVYTTSGGPSSVAAWDSDGFCQHIYHGHYTVHPSARMPSFVHESHLKAPSTPPASQGGTPVQDHDTCPQVAIRGCSRVREAEYVQPGISSPTGSSSDSTSTTRSKIRSQETTSKRPLGRLRQVPAAQSSLRCTQCSKTFSKQIRLREHENSHLKNGVPAICLEPRCNKVYGRHADLARHQRSHHKGHLFPCKYCSKTFNRSDITRRHEEQSCRQRRAERASVTIVQSSIRSK